MLQIFAGPISIPDNPETRAFFYSIAAMLIIMYVTLVIICSLIVGYLIKLVAKKIAPNSKLNKRLSDQGGLVRYIVTMSVVSTLSIAIMFKTLWPWFDGFESDTTGNILFVVFVIVVDILLASAVFLGFRKAPNKKNLQKHG